MQEIFIGREKELAEINDLYTDAVLKEAETGPNIILVDMNKIMDI